MSSHLDSGIIHTSTSGRGRPVLFLHGLFGSGENLALLARRLPEGYRAILADLPGHGRSAHIEDMSYAAIADVIANEVCAQLEEPPLIVGHSMGGKAAMMLALRHPEQVAGLVILDIAPVTYADRHRTIFTAMQAVDAAGAGSRREADALLAEYIPEAPVRGFLLKNFIAAGRSVDYSADHPADRSASRSGESGHTHWRIPVATLLAQYDHVRGWETPQEAEPFEGPVSCIYGSDSAYVDPGEHYSLFSELFADVQLTAIEGAGHWLHATHTDAVVAELNRFIQQHA